jgi:signal transduction histidine kinase
MIPDGDRSERDEVGKHFAIARRNAPPFRTPRSAWMLPARWSLTVGERVRLVNKAELSADEARRLEALRAYGILDAPSDPRFEDLARLAAFVCKTPIAAIGVVDADRQCFFSPLGLTSRAIPRDVSFCAHAVLEPDLFIVPDARADARFAGNPLVVGAPNVRFYAGVRLLSADGHALGALGVMDDRPRELDRGQREALQRLAGQVGALLEMRRLVARVAEREAAEAAETADRRASFLAAASRIMASSLECETTLPAVALLAVPEQADWCAIDLLDEHGTLRRVGVAATDQRRVAATHELAARYAPCVQARYGVGKVLCSGEPELYPDVADATLVWLARDAEHLRLLRALGLRSRLSVPLVARERIIGVLSLGIIDSGRRYGPGDLAFAQEVAHRLSVAVDNARLYLEAQRQAQAAEAARAAAQAANRAKDEFLAMLGHELRNPLAAIAAGIAVLDRARFRDRMAQETRGIIKRQVKHLARLLDDLLDVGRLTAGKVALARQGVDLRALVERSVAELSATGRLQDHVTQLQTADAWVDADPARLEQVVTNLINNAVKYTPREGTITVQVGAEDGEAVLRVADTGTGIPPELLPRVFDLFVQGQQRLDRAEGGLGIGLTLVRRLVELHGGRVEAHSAGRGRGSEFVVRLPAIPRVPAIERGHDGPVSARPRRVLLVEDKLDTREALWSELRLAGHEVYEAVDGEAALAAAARLKPEVVLLDIGLPGIDGYEVARRLRSREETRHARLIALTGHGQAADRQRASEAGFDAYLVKPVDPERIARMLAEM